MFREENIFGCKCGKNKKHMKLLLPICQIWDAVCSYCVGRNGTVGGTATCHLSKAMLMKYSSEVYQTQSKKLISP
jgi:hypothetical protein